MKSHRNRYFLLFALAFGIASACNVVKDKSDGENGGTPGSGGQGTGGSVADGGTAGLTGGSEAGEAGIAGESGSAGEAGVGDSGSSAGGMVGSGGTANGGTANGGTANGGTANGGNAGIGGAGIGPLLLEVTTATDPAVPGGRLLYTTTVTNVSARAVDAVKILLRVPAGLQFVYTTDAEPNATCGLVTCTPNSEATWTLGTLAAGSREIITVNAQVLQTVGDGDSISATFNLTATGVNAINMTKTVPVYSHPSAQLALGSAADLVTANQTLSFDLDVGQIGATPLTGTELRAQMPAGLSVGAISDGGTQATNGDIVWPIGGLPVGAALHRKVDVTVAGGLAAGQILTARASLIHDGGVAVDAAAEHSLTLVAEASPLKVDLSAATNPVASAGRESYTVTVSNTSARAIDGVGVLLRVPAGLQFVYTTDAEPNATCGLVTCAPHSESAWVLGSLAAGSSRTITVNTQVLANAVGDGSLIRASVSASATGLNSVNAVKTVQIFSQPSAQLALGTATDPVTANQPFSYDIDVGQIGVTALSGSELRAYLPAGVTVAAISDGGSQPTPGVIAWTIGSVAVGGTLHRRVDVIVNGTVSAGSILTAHASLNYDGGAAVDAATDRAVSVVAATLPLTVSVSATPDPVLPAGRLLYTTTITNTSARAIDGIAVLFRVPAGLQFVYTTDADPDATCGLVTCTPHSEAAWAFASLAAGMTQTITVNALVQATLTGGSLITSSTQVTATGLPAPINVGKTVPTHP